MLFATSRYSSQLLVTPLDSLQLRCAPVLYSMLLGNLRYSSLLLATRRNFSLLAGTSQYSSLLVAFLMCYGALFNASRNSSLLFDTQATSRSSSLILDTRRYFSLLVGTYCRSVVL